MRSILLSSGLVFSLLGGCAAATNKPEANHAGATGGAEPEMICHEEAATGSNISHTVCRPRETTEQDRDNAQRQMQRPQPHPSAPSGGR